MRILILAAWLLLLPVAFAFHQGPGQTRKASDAAAAELTLADRLAKNEQYDEALEHYDLALKSIPGAMTTQIRKIRIERAKSMMLAKKLPEAHADLKGLVDELQEARDADPQLLAEARSVLANSQYYMTWLMRLEGLGRDHWEPEIESARQTYKLLAEQAQARGDAQQVKICQEDLEAAIRLARMDLSELEGLPLPSQ